MSYAPWDESVADLITGPHEQTFRAVATDGTNSLELDLVDVMVDETERRTPRFTATLDCVAPLDDAVFEWLDPRALVRVDLFAGYRAASGELDEHQLYSLHLRERNITRGDGEDAMTLTCASDEFLLLDGEWTNGGVAGDSDNEFKPFTFSGGALDYITSSITEILTPTAVGPPTYHFGITETEDIGDVLTTGSDLWSDGIEVLMELYGFDVWHNGLDTWNFTPRTEDAGTPVHQLVVGQNGTVQRTETNLTRDAFANRATIRWAYKDPAGSGKTIYDFGTAEIPAGPFAWENSADVVKHEERRGFVGSLGTRNGAAQKLLNRLLARSRGVRLGAVNAWWLHVGDTTTVQLATGDAQPHIVAGVIRRPLDGVMDVVTRTPLNTDTIGE